MPACGQVWDVCGVCDTPELWRGAAGLCARVRACVGAAESLHTHTNIHQKKAVSSKQDCCPHRSIKHRRENPAAERPGNNQFPRQGPSQPRLPLILRQVEV